LIELSYLVKILENKYPTKQITCTQLWQKRLGYSRMYRSSQARQRGASPEYMIALLPIRIAAVLPVFYMHEVPCF
jgi:hypothetical protein